MIINIILLKTIFGKKEKGIVILIDKFLGNTHAHYWKNENIKICEICDIPRNEKLCKFPFACFLIKEYLNSINLVILYNSLILIYFHVFIKTNKECQYLNFIFDDTFNIFKYDIDVILNVIKILCVKIAKFISKTNNTNYIIEYNDCLKIFFFNTEKDFVLMNYKNNLFKIIY